LPTPRAPRLRNPRVNNFFIDFVDSFAFFADFRNVFLMEEAKEETKHEEIHMKKFIPLEMAVFAHKTTHKTTYLNYKIVFYFKRKLMNQENF
jgi:hypothetical protein